MELSFKRFIFPTLLISLIYIIFVTYSMNFSLLKDTLMGDYSFLYKTKLLFTLLQGMRTSMSLASLLLLFLVAFLTGANITLLITKIKDLKKFDKLHIVVGGNSLLGIIGSGCAACGLPILSLLGISGSLMYLPLHGAEISYISAALLGISLFLLVQNKKQACVVQYDKRKR